MPLHKHICAALLATLGLIPLSSSRASQEAQDTRPALTHRDARHTVVSRSRLDPPLRTGNRRVRFSPDGTYILLQDDSGIRLFTHDPLSEKFYVAASRVLPAVFTSDSSSIVIGGINLDLAVVSVNGNGKADPKRLTSAVKECISASLSPTGNAFACVDSSFKLRVFRIPDGREIVSVQPFTIPSGWYRLERLPSGSAFSEPFGYVVTNAPPFSSTPNEFTGNLIFSPDGHYVIAPGYGGDLIGFDTTTGQKFSVPGSLHRREPRSLHFSGMDQVVFVHPQKPDESSLFSFPDGRLLKKIGISGAARDTTGSGYLVYSNMEMSDSGILDLRSGETIVKLSDPAADVYNRDVATYLPDGNLVLSHLNDSAVHTARTTIGLFPMLQVAAVSPDLSLLTLSTGGEGAVFRIADGKRIRSFRSLRGGWCNAPGTCYASTDTRKAGDIDVKRIDVLADDSASLWSRSQPGKQSSGFFTQHDEYFPSASVWFQHTTDFDPDLFFSAHLENHGSSQLATSKEAGFSLRAIETQTGNELWKRNFERDAPVPFSDPQGDRFVVGWKADSSAGRRAIKENSIASEEFKHDRQANRDSYFEVLDQKTGKSLGGVLAQLDSAPEEFDSAFSEGDWLVLAKDAQRVFVYSLSTGQQILKVFGWRPMLSPATGSLCFNSAGNRLTTYDLKTAQKLRDYEAPIDISYAHYSADGQRLLVLTADQNVFVLDVRKDPVPKAN